MLALSKASRIHLNVKLVQIDQYTACRTQSCDEPESDSDALAM